MSAEFGTSRSGTTSGGYQANRHRGEKGSVAMNSISIGLGSDLGK